MSGRQQTLVSQSVRRGVLASAVAAALGTSGPVSAQEGPQQSATEEVVVTGSRIARRDFEANSPIMTIDSQSFEESSTVAMESVINKLPQFVPAASQFESEGTSTGGYQSGPTRTVGSATLSLRGLGVNRNLVLLDGRRAQPVNANMAVNINSIPSAAVERVETITGGASSVYGADAIAGVVNFVLKRDFEGFDLDMQYGQTSEGDGEEQRISAVLGANFAGGLGNVLVGMESAKRGEIKRRDRDFYQAGYADPNSNGDGRITAASIVPSGGNPVDPAVIAQLFPNATGNVGTSGSFYLNSDGSVYRNNSAGAYRYDGPMLDRDGQTVWRKVHSDGSLEQNRTHIQAQYPLERWSLFSRGHFELADNVRVFGSGLLTQTEGRAIGPLTAFIGGWGASVPHGPRLYAPSVRNLGADGLPNTGDAGEDMTTVPTFTAGGPYGLDCGAVGGCTVSEVWPKPPEVQLMLDSRPDPNGDITIGANPQWIGQKMNTTDNETFQLLAGFEGEFSNRDWTWEIYASHGETHTQSVFGGTGRLEGWRFLVNQPNYGTGLQYTTNEFGNGFGAGTIYCESGVPVMYGVNGWDEALWDDVPSGVDRGFEPTDDCVHAFLAVTKDTSVMEQNIVEANLQGTLAELPAGPLGFALGASHRKNEYNYIPDTLNTNAAIRDSAAGIYPGDASFGQISADDVYGELLVPLLANKPGVQQMSLELGFRSSKNTPSEDIDSYKALLDWRFTDRVRLRGGHQVANRAPNVAELFQSSEQQFYFTNNGDWCSTANPNPAGANPAVNPNAAQVEAICRAIMGPAGAAIYYSEEQNAAARSARWLNVVGNPDLRPETASTTTVGIVADLTDRITMSVDHWSIKINDMVSSQNVETFHEQCFSPVSNPTFDPNYAPCQLIERNPSNGNQSPYFVTFTNEAAIDQAGFDILLDWAGDVGPGMMSLGFQASILDHSESRPDPDSDWVDWKGSEGPVNVTGVTGWSYDYKTFTTLSYGQGSWTTSLRWRHLPSITSTGAITAPTVDTTVPTDSYNMFDLSGRYSFAGGFDLRFGIDNLFDTDPEIVFAEANDSGLGSTNPNHYDILGRRFYAGLKVSF